MAKTRIHLVCNTHWDREHRHPFQETRVMLIETVDRLLEIMESDPQFKTFTFDGQCVWLDDYLEVKPQNRERIRKLVEAGRIQLGPWYSLDDHGTVHPEAIVRNLLTGHRMAREFGGVEKFGYSIFSFGQVAQLPQVYKGFGIEDMIFYKGCPRAEQKDAEFLWEGPDGSVMLCSKLGPVTRTNFFMHFTVPVILGGDMRLPGAWKIDYARPARLCHMIDRAYDHPHAKELEPDYRIREELIPQAVEDVRGSTDSLCEEVAIAFDGIDFSRPVAQLPEAIRIANAQSDKAEIFFSTPAAYFEELRKHLDLDQLAVWKTEMRHGPLSKIHSELLPTAPKIKQSMQRAEMRLIELAEKFSAFGGMAGRPYPEDELSLCWKYLMRQQAHDSCHGIGVPEIQPNTVHWLEQTADMAESIATRAFEGIVERLDTADMQDGEIRLTVFNPSPQTRTEVLPLRVELPRDLFIQKWHIEDMDGNRIDQYEYERQPKELVSINVENRPKAMFLDWAEADVLFEKVPGFGYKTYRLIHDTHDEPPPPNPFPDPRDPYRPLADAAGRTMANEEIEAAIHDDGTLTLKDRKTGKALNGLHFFEDLGDAGDMWIHRPPVQNRIISTKGGRADVSLIRNSALTATFRIETVLDIPESLTQDRRARSEHRVPTRIRSDVTLRKGSRRVEIETRFDNQSRDHFLRVVFPGIAKTDQTWSDGAFEVRSRPADNATEHPEEPGRRGNEPRKYYMNRFVDVSDGELGLAVLPRGIKEFESFICPRGKTGLRISLIRSVTQRFPVHEDVFLEYEEEEAQSQGAQRFEYALCLHAGDWQAGQVLQAAREYAVPMTAAQYGRGRAPGALPPEMSFVTLSNPLIDVSAIKQAEDGKGWILRLWNTTDAPQADTLRFFRPPSELAIVNMEECEPQPLAFSDGAAIELKPHAILTLQLRF